jgi:glutamine amidotransferase
MQLMATRGVEYGIHAGLDWIAGDVVRIEPGAEHLKIPHMGWNELTMRTPSPLLEGVDDGAYVYFVHSYAAPVGPWSLSTTDYGGEFSSAVRFENFHGVQFHPERSARPGARVLANFLEFR